MDDSDRDIILVELKKTAEENKKSLTEIVTVLKGYNGKQGLCEQVEKNTKNIVRLTIVCIILASIAGGGTFAAVRALLGI